MMPGTTPTAKETLWRHCTPGAEPTDTPVVVWHWSADGSTVDDRYLSDDELQRAATMTPESRRRFVVHRSTLRTILATWLGTGPADIAFSYSGLGRPSLAHPGSGIDFNLSHSGNDAVLAISRVGAVGVDLEQLRVLPDYLAIARRLWPADWTDQLRDAAPPDRQRRFFEMWTRFEACQKAVGGGVFSSPAGADRANSPFQVHPGCIGHLCLGDPRTALPPVAWLRLAHHD